MKMCSEVFQFEKELKWENPGPGIRRQIMGYDEQLMMVKVQFEKGAVGTMHEHHHSQAMAIMWLLINLMAVFVSKQAC